MVNGLLKIFGFRITLIFGDASTIDRFFWLRKNLKKGDVRTLDAGCGSGSLSFYAAHVGNEVLGISFQEENNKTATERARVLNLANAKFITGDLRKLDTIVASFS